MAETAYLHVSSKRIDDLLNDNKKCLNKGLESIKGFASMPLEATYLAWINFENTGLTQKFYSLLFGKLR